jgi:hypothetical protein
MKSVKIFPKPTENKYKYSVGKIDTKKSVKDKENRKVKLHGKQNNSDRHDETFKIKRNMKVKPPTGHYISTLYYFIILTIAVYYLKH